MRVLGETMDYQVEILDTKEDPVGLAFVVQKHAEAPQEWGMDYEPSELDIAHFTELATAENAVLQVIRDAKKIIAFLWFNFGETRVELLSLWTDPDYRRKGMAKKLKIAAEKWGRDNGKKLMTTTVFASNTKMIALNELLGYDIVSYQMEKKLTD